MLKRHHAPVALVVTALGTIVLSIIVSIASGDYYDGPSVPFISYVGRDEPSYYVFAIGMSLSGAGVAVVAVLERRGSCALAAISVSSRRAPRTCSS